MVLIPQAPTIELSKEKKLYVVLFNYLSNIWFQCLICTHGCIGTQGIHVLGWMQSVMCKLCRYFVLCKMVLGFFFNIINWGASCLSEQILAWRTHLQWLLNSFGQDCCQKEMSQEVQGRELMNWQKGYVLMYFLHSVELTFFDLLSEELLSLSLSRSVCYPEMLVMFIN